MTETREITAFEFVSWSLLMMIIGSVIGVGATVWLWQ